MSDDVCMYSVTVKQHLRVNSLKSKGTVRLRTKVLLIKKRVFRIEWMSICFDAFHILLKINQHLTEIVVQRCSVKKGVLKNFAKFTGKHLCESLFFNQVAGLRFFGFLKVNRCLMNFENPVLYV